MTGPIPGTKSRAVHLLAQHHETVRVFTSLDHSLTTAEAAVLNTVPMQRMSRLRQTGLAYLLFPTAEHTRLAHCLGTTYWVSRFLASVRSNSAASSQCRLAELDAALGPDLSLDLLARVFSLIHDSDLLPLGHTLSYQLGYFPPPGTPARFHRYVNDIRGQVRFAPELAALGAVHCGADSDPRGELLACLERHLDAATAIAAAEDLLAGRSQVHPRLSDAQIAALVPAALFVNDLVTSTVSADLLDFALRDTWGAGMPWNFDTRLLERLDVLATTPAEEVVRVLQDHLPTGAVPPQIYRFGLNAVCGQARRHEAVTGVISLLRVRYEVLERIVYHPRKCAADAMVDRAIRNLGERFRAICTEDRLLTLGDDAFLDLLAAAEAEVAFPAGTGPTMPDLLARRLFREVYRLEDRSRLTEFGRQAAATATDSARRTAVERRLAAAAPGIPESEFVFSARPLSMQAKQPDTLIGWFDGTVQRLADIANDDGYGTEALETTRRYDHLWSLSVYARASLSVADQKLLRGAAATLFQT